MEGGWKMNANLLTGKLVRLCAEEPEVLAKAFSGWSADSEYLRLLDWDPANRYSVKNSQKWFEKDLEKEDRFFFAIRRLEGEDVIGFIVLNGIRWSHGESFVGIGLGEREAWGKGYGTDAMQVLLRFAFMELNLERVSLDVFEYNPRGIRSYEKAGFVIEGRERAALLREGKRWDLVFMGILRNEWLLQDRKKKDRRV
jgi:RimJ/RimL family protein N-acetyltransferase